MSNPETAMPNENMDDLKQSASNAKEAIGDFASEAGRYAKDRMGEAKKSVSAAVDAVKNKAGEYSENVVAYIKKNPYRSLAIAAGIGLALGFMLRRR